MSHFYVSEINPNVEVGGGGCVCSGETAGEDCTGPYAVFPTTSTDSNISPHVVLCLRCASEAADELAEAPETVDGEVVEESVDDAIPVI